MMNESLQRETEQLTRSWMQHEPGWLRDYLISGVEDPRLNLQSILTRHFLLRARSAEKFSGLMQHECRFAAAMAWLLKIAGQGAGPEDFEAIHHALKRGGDNAEGIEIPHFLGKIFATLPAQADGATVPNYLEAFLTSAQPQTVPGSGDNPVLDTFCHLWNKALSGEEPAPTTAPLMSVLEPACGSANDYRFLHCYGLARFMDYTGFDLCDRNVENARALFPGIRFERGNVFEIAAADKSFDFCIVHDLFEHLSLAGLEAAIGEVCRVTRGGLCLGFFQMDEIPEHQVRPVEEYHWNLLSMTRMKEGLARRGFSAQALHIGTFLRQQVGARETHNPNAYTFFAAAI